MSTRCNSIDALNSDGQVETEAKSYSGGVLPGFSLPLAEMCVGGRTASDLKLMKNSFGIQRDYLASKKQVDSPRSCMI